MDFFQTVITRFRQVDPVGLSLMGAACVLAFAAATLHTREKITRRARLAMQIPALVMAFAGVILVFLP